MGATAKRLDVSILLDSERHEALRAYAKAKKTENIDDAVTLVVNTGLSRIAALRKHAANQEPKERKPRAAKAEKPKAAKGKKVAKKAAKKVKAKPAAASKAVKRVAKANTPVKLAKSGASVSRIAPQKPGPAAEPPEEEVDSSSDADDVSEAAEA